LTVSAGRRMAAAWQHPRISKEKAEELLGEGGVFADGKFLVREHSQPNQHILSVCYKGRATHHLLSANNEGTWTVNKKVYGPAGSVAALIELLTSKPPGWPVALGDHVSSDGTNSKVKSGGGAPGGDGKAAARPDGQPGPSRSGATSGSIRAPPGWLHRGMTKEKAEELLAAGKDGQFLVRSTKPGAYILSITFRGKPTHHKLAKTDDGVFAANGKSYGTSTKNVTQFIAALAKKPKGWPVAFVEYATADGSFKPMGAATAQSAAANGGPTRAPSVREGGGGTPQKGASTRKKGGRPPYIYGPLPKQGAEERLAGHNDGANADGTFLIRKKPNDPAGNNYVLSVIFRGKPTHHRVFREAAGDPWTVNKTDSGVSTLPELVKLLQAKKPWWPVPLLTPVPRAEDTLGAGGVSETVLETAAPAARDARPGWLVGGVGSKDEAATIVTKHCGGSVDGKDGTFCVWQRPGPPPAFIITVVFRSTVTHHRVANDGGAWTVNKKPLPGVQSIGDVVKYLGQKRPFWPVPLVNGVDGGGDDATAGTDIRPKSEPAPPQTQEEPPTVPAAAKLEDAAEPPVGEESPPEARDDDDGLPAPLQRDDVDASALVLDANGAPVVQGAPAAAPTEPEPEPEQDRPTREFEGGSYVDLTLTRESLTTSFGLQVEEAWLGLGKGHAVVVSAVIDGAPAADSLETNDILVQINGTVVESFRLENAKEVLRELGLTADVKVYRRREARAYLDDVGTEVVDPIRRTDHIRLQQEQYHDIAAAAAPGGKVKKAKHTVWSKPTKVGAKARKVSSIWDADFDDGNGMTPRKQEKELKRMLRDARRSGSRLDVVVTQHAIINPAIGKTPLSTTA